MSQEMRRALEEMADWILLGLISPEEAEEIIRLNPLKSGQCFRLSLWQPLSYIASQSKF